MVKVKVYGAPGYEDFEAELVPGLEEIILPAGVRLSVVRDPKTKEVFVVPAICVETL